MLLVCHGRAGAAEARADDKFLSDLRSGNPELVTAAVAKLYGELSSAPRNVVSRLNNGGMEVLLEEHRNDDVDKLAVMASIAVARDTWAVEQLQRSRVRALLASSRPDAALAAAKGLFMVAGMGSAPHDLDLLCRLARQAYPSDAGVQHRLRLQMLAAAQEDPGVRKAALAKAGEPILNGIKVDQEPYRQAIEELQRREPQDYDTLYAAGNLLLLSGRVAEAREAFQKAYDAAPPGEMNYASEGLAKVLKAEDLGIGRANAFVKSIRPAAKPAQVGASAGAAAGG